MKGYETPLSWAERRGHEEVEKSQLEQKDLDSGIQGRTDQTALEAAASQNQARVLQLLHQLKPSPPPNNTQNPSHRAHISTAMSAPCQITVRHRRRVLVNTNGSGVRLTTSLSPATKRTVFQDSVEMKRRYSSRMEERQPG
ncbi:hypothetical protein HOY80DRAFT_1050014 [Tuber brumale]|nr:hypothetical protein HOY80DRAFT_1050014 [Tuber brumale]